MKVSLKISHRDSHFILTFALVATILISGVAYLVLFPAATERYFAMSILSSGELANSYYPNNNPTLTSGERVNWTIGVYNHMAELEYVVLRVKLLNSTLEGPDELTGTPSPVSDFFEFSRILLDNESWSIPFIWSILNVTQQGQSFFITGISINQFMISGNLGSATAGMKFRLVFELWFYDDSAGKLSFSWSKEQPFHSVWTQVWFNATIL